MSNNMSVKLDPLSYMSHARLKILLSPLGPIKRSRFRDFSQLFHRLNNVRLEDVAVSREEVDEYSETSEAKLCDYVLTWSDYFNPRTTPNGRVLLDIVSDLDREHSHLESFEYFRRIFAVILIADGDETHQEHEILDQIRHIKKSAPFAVLVQPFVIGSRPESQELWPPGSQHLDNYETMSTQLSTLRDALADFTSALFARMNNLYIATRERSDISSPYDPASDFIRPQPQRMSSFALQDAQTTPAASPPPGAERPARSNLGQGILTSGDRAKVLSNGRAAKLCADLLLICGFCNDALKMYTEAAAIARANNDYLWQGAALDGIGICLVLLKFLDIAFQVPQIAQNSSGTISYRKSERHSTSSNKEETDLVDFLPELYSGILGLYQKSTTTQSDQVPAFVLAETSLRLSNFLACVHSAGGLSRAALDDLVYGRAVSLAGNSFASYPPRAEIAAWAMRAYQGPITSLSLPDKLHIYSGLATVLGTIGFLRRRALFLREVVLALIPALVQARVTGAAGLGIHPAASLALSENHNNNFAKEVLMKTNQDADSLTSLLEDIARAYGIPAYSDETDLEEVILGNYGWPYLRNVIMNDCISICEAIPDFCGVLRFSARSLAFRAANLTQDEQVRLVANIPRILVAARRSGITNLDIDYWDSYLIRDVVLKSELHNLPTKRLKEELVANRDGLQKKLPFLYNPYDVKKAADQRLTLVQDQPSDIVVTLQNPFAFDIEALEIDLVAEGPRIRTTQSSAYLKAKSITTTTITCIAEDPGQLTLLGCQVRISGCRSRRFEILDTPTKQEVDGWHVMRGGIGRLKRTGVYARNSEALAKEPNIGLAKPRVVMVTVLPAVPTLLHRPNKPSPLLTIGLLEGELSTVHVALENTSVIAVTFLAFSFSDSSTESLMQAINSKAKDPSEIHDLETILYHRKALTYTQGQQATNVQPNSTTSFHFDVYGRKGMTTADIIITYGNVSTAQDKEEKVSRPESAEEFYTRQLRIPVKFNLQQALSIVHCDIVTLAQPLTTDVAHEGVNDQFRALFSTISHEDEYSVMILDVRNSFNHTIKLHIRFENEEDVFAKDEDLPGQSQRRLLIPVKRTILSREQSSTPIPSLSNRQFIVSSTTPALEMSNRELFWARESLLARLKMTYALNHLHQRNGRLEERSIVMTRRMMEKYLLPPLSISCKTGSWNAVTIGKKEDVIVELRNRGREAVRVLLRITIAHELVPDVSMSLFVIGASQYPLTIEAGTRITTERVAVVGLLAGQYQFQASIAPLDQLESVTVSRKLFVNVVK